MFRLTSAATVLLFASAGFVAAQPPAAPPKLALLVGCTTYPNHPNFRTLYGPANDVKVWRETLTGGFGFKDADITTLAEWPDDKARRPTAANITKAFEALIAAAKPGAQVFILMSGHGVQQPLPAKANPLDPKNVEPDGMDEVFLPADVEKADKDGQLTNALLDNQFGEWLDQLRAKGAHVMIVFDCCHSGTATRGGNDPKAELRDITRTVPPTDLGIRQELIDAAANRAKAAVEAAEKKAGEKLKAPPPIAADPKAKGSLVAFYGAQSFEEAVELPLPEGAAIARGNYYGLLSFTLLQSLKGRESVLSYRELEQAVGAGFRKERGMRGPTPYAEGDLDRQVLGYTVWPKRSLIVLEKTPKGALSVNAGTLAGVTDGSVLAVFPPAGDPRDPKTPLGYVKVTEGATVASAVVIPCEYDGTPKVKADALPSLGRCEVVARDYGDTRVKLFLDGSPAVTAGFTAIGNIPDEGKEVVAMTRLVKAETEAEWILRAVTAKQAADEYGLANLKGDHVLLLRGAGREQSKEEKAEELKRVKVGLTRRVFGVYPVGDPKKATDVEELAGLIARDLPKLFRWQNLWRVASDTAVARGDSGGKLTLELVRQSHEKAKGPGEPFRGGVVPNDTFLDVRVENLTKQDLWVVPVVLSCDLEISVIGDGGQKPPFEVPAGKQLTLFRGHVNVKPGDAGQEGVVLLAVPQSVAKPDFKFLEQSPLKVIGKAPSLDRDAAPDTPFGRLLKASVVGAGKRGFTPVVDTTPLVVSGSWVVVP